MGYHHPPRTIRLGLARDDRKAIEAEIERLIALLDTLDGDADVEDDDPAGDPLDLGEMPADAELLTTLPLYAVDQTRGPINEAEAMAAHRLT